MKKLLLLFSIVTIASCTQSLEPSIENINSIFQSKDFTSEYIRDSHDKESMSFRDDYIVYKKAEGVKRRTITYKEALFINDFIQNQFQSHKYNNSETAVIAILNTLKKVTLKIANDAMDYHNLINKLDLEYVSAKKK